MRQFSIDQCEISWFGLDIKAGLAQGTSVTEARTSPSWALTATGMGRGIRVYNPDRTGTVTVVVDQTSPLHQQLRLLAQADRLARNIVGTMTLHDISSGEFFHYQNAFILTEPDETRGTEAAQFSWVFAFENLDHVTTDINASAVGS